MSEIKFIRLAHVRQLTGLSRSSIYAMMKKSSFPKSIKLGERAAAWVESEVQEWQSSRIKCRSGEVA